MGSPCNPDAARIFIKFRPCGRHLHRRAGIAVRKRHHAAFTIDGCVPLPLTRNRLTGEYRQPVARNALHREGEGEISLAFIQKPADGAWTNIGDGPSTRSTWPWGGWPAQLMW